MKVTTYEQQEQKRELKERMTEYLNGRSIDTRRPFNCLNPDHEDKNPSMSYDAKNNRVKCFSCNASYDVIDLIAIERGIPQTDHAAKFKAAREYFGYDRPTGGATGAATPNPKPKTETKTETDYSAFFLQAQASISETDYLQQRCISQETAARFGLGYVQGFNGWPGALIIPTSRHSYEARNTDAGAEHGNRYRKKGAARLFNLGALRTAQKPVFIVEGVIDCLSVLEGGGEAVGLGSADNYGLLLAELEKQRPIQPLIIALDNDKTGEETTAKIESELKRLEISFYRHVWNVHDANDELQADKEKFIAALREAEELPTAEADAERAAYIETSAAASMGAFESSITERAATGAIPTGFYNLDDKILDGGLFEGLYVVGAISSLGKTSFIIQIADYIAAHGYDVLYFSLEMSKFEIMAKSLSRETYRLADETRNAKTTRGILAGAKYAGYSEPEKYLIEQAKAQYSSYAERLFIFEGIGEIGAAQVRAAVEKHIKLTGNAPVVFIDYIQILAPYEAKATDKQNTDKAVLELKRISRDFKIPVIGVSSFNRANYSIPVSMESFKESGAVEYSSDVLIGLQLEGAGTNNFNVNAAKAKEPRDIQLIVLKNRNGATGRGIELEYFQKFNLFKDKKIIEWRETTPETETEPAAKPRRGRKAKAEEGINEQIDF